MPPTVSICLPVFNGQQHLGEAIESVLSQSFQDFELIIVDDYSTDGSRWVMDQYARKDGRIKCYANSERHGLFANYNLCLQHSTGNIIKPFAQDDLLNSKNLEWCVAALQSNPQVSLVATARNWIDETGADVSDTFRAPSFSDFFDDCNPVAGIEIVSRSLIPVINFIGEPACVAFPRDQIASGFDPGFHHLGDLDYWLRILLNGQFIYNPEELCSFRRHQKNQTNINLSELRVATDLLRIGRKFKSVLIESGFSEREFMRSALKLIADQLYMLTRSDEAALSAGLTDPSLGKQETPDDSLYLQRARRLLSTLSSEELRDLTSYALELLVVEGNVNYTRPSQQSDGVKRNEKSIARYERKLSRLLDDPRWKTTTAFRVANKYVHRSAAPGVSSEQPASGKSGSEQEEYIQFLKSEISGVKGSRSWALGQFLKQPDFRPAPLTALAGRLLGRRTLHQEIRELNRTAKRARVEPRVSWQPVDSLIREVIYDFRSPKSASQLATGVDALELDAESGENQRPQISLLLSVEREEPTLILEALANQSVPPEDFEVIMVDATDTPDLVPATRAFMQGRENKLRLRAFLCVPGGRAIASNIQMRMASSDLILFLAGDFVPPPTFVESHIEFHRQHSNETVGGIGGASFPAELKDTHLRRWLDDSGTLFGVRLTDDSVDLPPNFFYMGNASVKKSLVFQAGLFDEDFPYDAYEDYEFGLRLRKMGVQFKYIPGTVCMHHHPITLRERMSTQNKAAESAVVIDEKHAGVKPWHRMLYTPALVHTCNAAGHAIRYCFSGRSEHLIEFFEGTLQASFAYCYKKHLRKQLKQLQLRSAD